MRRTSLSLALLIGAFLAACGVAGTPNQTPNALLAQVPTITPSSTLLPHYVETPQAAQAAAQATIAAGQAESANLAVTATVIALNAENANATATFRAREIQQQAQVLAVQLTQAAATSQSFERETVVAATATALRATTEAQSVLNAQSAAIASTRQAGIDQATQVALSIQAQQTQIYLARLQADTQAAIERIADQRTAERQTLLFRTWVWRVFWLAIAILAIILVWKTIPWVLLRVFGIDPKRPIVYMPNKKGGFDVWDYNRALQPGVTTDGRGVLLPLGGADDDELQAQVTARAQAAELMRAINDVGPAGQTRSRGDQDYRRLRNAATRQMIQAAAPPSMPALPVVDGQVKYLAPDDPRVRPLIVEADQKLLEAGNDDIE